MTTTLENLRTRKLQLEQHSRHALSQQEREQIEGELMKIEIALTFLDQAEVPAGGQTRKPPLGRVSDGSTHYSRGWLLTAIDLS
jgi:hypothetical protein